MRLPSRTTEPALSKWSLGMDEGLPRLWRGFMTARILVAVVLLLLILFLNSAGQTSMGRELVVCSAYLALTCWVRFAGQPERAVSRFDPRWVITVGVDVLVFAALLHYQVGALNFTPLFALPVLLAAVLGTLLLALGTAAAVTLALLADAWWMSMTTGSDVTSRFLQAALTGLGLFVVAYLANQLAMRLARQERLVHMSTMAARAQTQVNQSVIDTLNDGVLVVDANGVVRTANPAARTMLGPRIGGGMAYEGLLPHTPFVLASQANWQPLVDMATNTMVQRQAQRAEVAITDSAGTTRKLMVRTQLVVNPTDMLDADSLCVMFLEDLREMEARLRTEKLAAMGRMSAAVAHEIRNPLAAISQANALLAEELLQPNQVKLTHMVGNNAKRLARIVDDILDVSRAQPLLADPWHLPHAEQFIAAMCQDWAAQNGCVEQLLLPTVHSDSTIIFEEEHLRRVMVNLLDNALRYASKRIAAIQVTLQLTQAPSSGAVAGVVALRLSVWSDAAPIEQGVQRHLFEPFFSSESRSSGLGLYICRELCARHGASIGYQRVEPPVSGAPSAEAQATLGNEFFVHFALATALV
jgi:two-component system, NtrC family, sensor histidine kinase PilS